WKLSLGDNPLTSPVIGPDGFVVAAYGSSNSGIAVVRPDGTRTQTALAFGPAIHELAVGPDRMIYVTTSSTSQDALKRIDLYCPGFVACQAIDVPPIGAPTSTPPLLAGGSVFIGKANGGV